MPSSKVLKAGIGYVIGNYLLKGLVFLTIPIFSRLLSPSDYGIYNTFVAYESIGAILLGCAIHSSYKNARYKYTKILNGKNQFDSYVSSTMLFLLVAVVAYFFCVFLNADQLSLWLGLEKECLYLLVPFCFGSAVIMCFNSYMGLQYKYKNYLRIASLNAVSSIALSIILIKTVFKSSAYLGRAIGTTCPIALIGIFIALFFLKRARPTNCKEFLGWGLKYSLPIVPHGLSQILLSQFDRIMIFRMIGMAEAGIYSFGYNIYTIYFVTMNSIDNVWGPWFYEKRHALDIERIKTVSTLYTLFMAMFASALLFISPELVKILAPESYREGIYSVIPIVGSGFFVFLYTLPASVEYFHEKTKFIAMGTVSAAVLNIGLNLFFIPRFGYISAGYTTLATYIAYFIFHYILAWKIEKRCIFSTEKIALIASCVLGMVALARFLVDFLIIRWAIAILLGILLVFLEEKKIGFIRKKMRKK